MPVFDSDRLHIELLTTNDASFLYELMNTPKWLEFIGDRNIKSIADAEGYIEKSIISTYQNHGFGLYKLTLKTSGNTVGVCGLLQRDYLESPDLGFAMLPQFEGKGYTTEASRATMEYAKQNLSIKAIMAITVPSNKASIGVLQKLGFQKHETVQPNEEKGQLLVFRKVL